jgi:lipopolysaccharide biosynthesis regulator YciM
MADDALVVAFVLLLPIFYVLGWYAGRSDAHD